MKKSLFAILLAVVMVAAVVFVSAPATKAEAEADITLTANATETLVINADQVLNLNGFDATVSVNEGVTLTIVDTSFMNGDWDLSGNAAGTLTVAEGSEGTIKAWAQFGDYKYLAVKSKDGTYSAHPFNIMLSTVGVNTHSTKITVGITVIADNVVANLIDAGEFGLHNLTLDGQPNHKDYENRYAKHTAKFDGKNGLRVYFDLDNSLSKDVLTANRSNQFGAYIKVDAGYGALTVDSLSTTEIAPKTVLEEVNAKANTFAAQQKAKMAAMLDKEDAAYLKDYCDRFKSTWVLVTDVADLNAGDIIVIAAKDYNFALSTTQNWLANTDMTQDKNQFNRGQTSAFADDKYIFFGADVQPLTLGTATVNGTSYFTFYTGNGYLRCGSNESSSRLQTFPSPATGNGGYWSIVINENGTTITAPLVVARNVLQYNTSGMFTCHAVDAYKEVVIYRCAHDADYTNWPSVETAPTCTEDGIKTYTCSSCGIQEIVTLNATGHDFGDNGVCTVCGHSAATKMPTTTYSLKGSSLPNEFEDKTTLTISSDSKYTNDGIYIINGSYFIMQFPGLVESITFTQSRAKYYPTISVSKDGINWENIAYTGSGTEMTVDLNGSYKFIKFATPHTSYTRVATLTVNPPAAE